MSKRTKPNSWKLLWCWVVGAFVLLVGAWSWLIVTAFENTPESLPLVHESK